MEQRLPHLDRRMTPAPTQQSGSTPWPRNQPYAAGGIGKIKQDGSDIGDVTRRGVSITTFTSTSGPGSSTFTIEAERLPFTLVVTVTDGGTDTTTDYDMGVSNDSQVVSLTATEQITDVTAKRRF